MNITYLILGGNIGDRLKNLEKARFLISKNVGSILKCSEIFVTAAWGKTNQPDFYNQALQVQTNLKPLALLEELLKTETASGRIRNGEKWAERTMDVDILFYNEEIISEPHLKIPHPHIQDRRFVLAPLAEIAGEYQHPVCHKNIFKLLEECPDASAVRVLESRH
jgi:2-amino-4-hydroxy-6-hydroxymethyldihydropteridine diphosphokinase